MGQVKKMLEYAFECDSLTDAEEELLDRLEAEYYAMRRGEELENYDYYSIQKQKKSAE
jgi:hypothetical protein